MNVDRLRVALRELGIEARVSIGSHGNVAVVTTGIDASKENYLLVAGVVRREDPDAFVKVTFTPGKVEAESLQTCFTF